MERHQKSKPSRFGEQVGRAGWTNRLTGFSAINARIGDRFLSNKHSASELILSLLEQISKFLKRMAGKMPRSPEKAPGPEKVGKRPRSLEKARNRFEARLGEQAGRAGWASKLGKQAGRAGWAGKAPQNRFRKGPEEHGAHRTPANALGLRKSSESQKKLVGANLFHRPSF